MGIRSEKDEGEIVTSCWKCMGDGGWHDCGEDCCCCADPEELNVYVMSGTLVVEAESNR